MSGFRVKGKMYFCKWCGDLIYYDEDMVRIFVEYVKDNDKRRLEVRYDYYHINCWYEQEGVGKIKEKKDKRKDNDKNLTA